MRRPRKPHSRDRGLDVEGARGYPVGPTERNAKGMLMGKRQREAKERDAQELAAPDANNVVRYTVEEVRHQLEVIEGMMTLGATVSRVVSNVTRPPPLGLGITKYRAAKLMDRIRVRWAKEDEDRRSQFKSAAVRRIMTQIQNCQGRRAPRDPGNPNAVPPWVEKPDHTALVKYENLLADLQGTREPVQVEASVQYTETLVSVFAGYSLEDLQSLHERAERNRKLAEAYRRERPELAEAIEAEGHAAE